MFDLMQPALSQDLAVDVGDPDDVLTVEIRSKKSVVAVFLEIGPGGIKIQCQKTGVLMDAVSESPQDSQKIYRASLEQLNGERAALFTAFRISRDQGLSKIFRLSADPIGERIERAIAMSGEPD